jgi:hypothetical protein
LTPELRSLFTNRILELRSLFTNRILELRSLFTNRILELRSLFTNRILVPRRAYIYPEVVLSERNCGMRGRGGHSSCHANHLLCGLPLVPRWAYLSRGGPIRPEAGLSVPRRAHPSRGGPIRPEAGLSVQRRAYPSSGGPIRPAAGLYTPRLIRSCQMAEGGVPAAVRRIPIYLLFTSRIRVLRRAYPS